MLTSRELVKKALTFQELERVPREMYFDDDYLKTNFPSDVASPNFIYGKGKKSGTINKKGFWTDEWGCVWEAAEEGVKGEVKMSPLSDWSNLKSFQPPWDVLDNADLSMVNECCHNTDKFMISFWETAASPFQRMQFLRGTENLFMDLAYGEKEIFQLRDMIHEYFVKQLELWVQTDVDGIHIEDDWGSQNALLISPNLWREFFKPLYKEYCDIAHRHGKFVIMHSDGYILDIMSDLIEIGIDAVNAQLFCMDMNKLSKYSNKICFWGEIDRQYLLPFGTEKENRLGVRKVYNNLMKNKTGIVAQCHWGKDVQMSNVRAVFDEWNSVLK